MAGREFRYKVGRSFPVTADIVGKHIDKIARRDGECSAQAFVNAARPDTSAIHRLFEWNDPVEAEKWRCHVARNVIASVRVRVESASEEGQAEPAFLSVRRISDDGEETHDGYRAYSVVRKNPDDWQAWLQREWAHIRGDIERVAFADEFEALVAMIPIVDEAIFGEEGELATVHRAHPKDRRDKAA